MLALKVSLDAIDPRVWYMVVGGLVWLLAYAWRRFLPSVWAAAVEKNPALPQIWMVVIGSLLALQPALGKPLWQAVEEVLVTAALTTIGANGIHAALRGILPSKYNGAAVRVQAAADARSARQAVPPVTGP